MSQSSDMLFIFFQVLFYVSPNSVFSILSYCKSVLFSFYAIVSIRERAARCCPCFHTSFIPQVVFVHIYMFPIRILETEFAKERDTRRIARNRLGSVFWAE